ncbi:MAG TPA: glycosyltransferase family 2 protein [Trueperaceae bacterium]|nr:glycosyltransferase family 2 protein [Trueperaceae bacterium]
MLRDLFDAYQAALLLYFVILNLFYAVSAFIGFWWVARYTRELPVLALKDSLRGDAFLPVSLLMPAHNEGIGIVASVAATLRLRFPEFEVIVVNDGSSDDTLAALHAAFSLIEIDPLVRKRIDTRAVRAVYASTIHPNLKVIDKVNGGKADALNAGLNLARYPIFCAVDADSLLEQDTMLRVNRLFMDDERVLAVGGTVRPVNGAEVRDGEVQTLRLPAGFLERMQIIEYARAFFMGRAGWNAIDGLLIISGAFGLFRRQAVIDVGGYRPDTVGEDMELVVRLHRAARDAGRDYRVYYVPDPICYTEVPSDWRSLRKQRNRWQRGLLETLWFHRGMVARPRYGRLGFLALPYFWLFEAASPVVEFSGYLLLPVAYACHLLDPGFALLFLALALGYGVLLSQLAVGIETLFLKRYPRLGDRFVLLLYAVVEALGYRQRLTFERLKATLTVRRLRGTWGEMARTGPALSRDDRHG